MEKSEIKELPKVAQSILLKCKKCAAERFHRVIAHASATSAKTECEICGSKKTFNLPKKGAKNRRPSPHTTVRNSWEELKGQYGGTSVKSYAFAERFEMHNSLQHPQFGLGFVTLVTPSKIEVVFADSVKTLVHNKKN